MPLCIASMIFSAICSTLYQCIDVRCKDGSSLILGPHLSAHPCYLRWNTAWCTCPHGWTHAACRREGQLRPLASKESTSKRTRYGEPQAAAAAAATPVRGEPFSSRPTHRSRSEDARRAPSLLHEVWWTPRASAPHAAVSTTRGRARTRRRRRRTCRALSSPRHRARGNQTDGPTETRLKHVSTEPLLPRWAQLGSSRFPQTSQSTNGRSICRGLHHAESNIRNSRSSHLGLSAD